MIYEAHNRTPIRYRPRDTPYVSMGFPPEANYLMAYRRVGGFKDTLRDDLERRWAGKRKADKEAG